MLSFQPSPKQTQVKLRAETWRCMQELQEKGVLRSIGVSNYDTALLQEVLDLGGVWPQVISFAGEPVEVFLCR